MSEIYYISRAKRGLILQEIEDEFKEQIRKLSSSVEGGGNHILSENPCFLEERARIMNTYDRKKTRYLNSVKIIIEDMPEYENFDGSSVIIGSSVVICEDGEVITYKILGSFESDVEHNIISCDAPISKELIGKKVGEIFSTARGSKIEILSVSI